MSDAYDVETADGVVIVTFREAPTLESLMAAIEAVAAASAPTRRLWDLGVGIELTTEELRRLAAIVRGLDQPAGSRVAVVASDDLTYGLSRMYQVYREDARADAAVFRTREEALRWLRAE